MRKLVLLSVIIAALATACGNHEREYQQQVVGQPAYQQAAPVIVQAAPQSSGMGNAFIGAAAGSVVGNMMSRPAAGNTVVVKKYYSRPSYRSSYRRGRR